MLFVITELAFYVYCEQFGEMHVKGGMRKLSLNSTAYDVIQLVFQAQASFFKN